MGGVVDAISDAVDSVVDTVGDAVEWVGDTASNIVENALDHPVETALTIGVIAATGGAGAAALGLEAPLTALEASSALAGVSGTSTLAHGGDLGDALTSAATTFAVSQGVSYAFDSFNAAGSPGAGGSTTTQYFDDGSSVQLFDDGSRLVTDSTGAVNPVAADETMAAGVQPSGAETTAVPPPGDVDVTTLPPAETAAAPEVTPLPATPQYETMEQLLADKGITYPESTATAPAAVTDRYDNLPDSVGNTPAVDPNAPAVNTTGKQYDTMEDLLYDKGELTEAQYKDLTGQAPVVDLSQTAEPMKDVSTIDAIKGLGGAAIDYVKENPWTTAAVIGGGLAATGDLGDNTNQAAATSDPTKTTYTYGPGAPVRRTGLAQLYSAADKIYGTPQSTTPVSQLVQAPQFQSNFQPLLVGAAPGAGNIGLGALGRGFSYTPMNMSQTYDISNMSPEQIVQMQEAINRKRQG